MQSKNIKHCDNPKSFHVNFDVMLPSNYCQKAMASEGIPTALELVSKTVQAMKRSYRPRFIYISNNSIVLH